MSESQKIFISKLPLPLSHAQTNILRRLEQFILKLSYLFPLTFSLYASLELEMYKQKNPYISLSMTLGLPKLYILTPLTENY